MPRPNTLLTGIAVHSQTSSATSGTLTYPLLKITVSRASVSSLSPTFASNLPAPFGFYIAFQSLAAETPAAPWPLTNAADCIING